MSNAKLRTSPLERYKDRSPPGRRQIYDTDHDESYGSDYSDDFEAVSKSRDHTLTRNRPADRTRRKQTNSYSSDHSSNTHLHSSANGRKLTRNIGRGGHRKPRPWHGFKLHNSPKTVYSHHDNITARMLSAKQRQINEMENVLTETENRLEMVLRENKLLKTVQHRQDRALRRFQDVESDLPRLISQNLEDQKVLKTRLKRAQGSEKALEEKLKENNDEMQKMERTLRKLKKVIYDKNLGERSELARQLTIAENNVAVTERRLKELEKKLELTSSSFTRQMKTECQRHKETKVKLDALAEEYQTTMVKLKEKERALGVSNIYAMRNKELSSLKSSPRANKQSTSSQTEHSLTLPDLGKFNPIKSSTMIGFKNQSKLDTEIMGEDSKHRLRSLHQRSPTPHIQRAGQLLKINSNINVDANALHSAPYASTNEKDAEHDAFLTMKFQSDLPSSNNPLVDSVTDLKPQDHILEQPGSIALVSSIGSERSDVDVIKYSEKQKNLEEEKAKLHDDQKKKAELLARMREIEEDGSVTSAIVSVEFPSPLINQVPLVKDQKLSISNTKPKSKPELVKSLLGTDTDPVIENLHRGLPSSNKMVEKELSFGSYAPSVGTLQANKNPARVQNSHLKAMASHSDNEEPLLDLDSGKNSKKSNLLAELFGGKSGNETDMPSKMGESVTPRAKPVHAGYPWERNVVTTTQVNGIGNHLPRKAEAVKSSDLIIDDDIEVLSL